MATFTCCNFVLGPSSVPLLPPVIAKTHVSNHHPKCDSTVTATHSQTNTGSLTVRFYVVSEQPFIDCDPLGSNILKIDRYCIQKRMNDGLIGFMDIYSSKNAEKIFPPGLQLLASICSIGALVSTITCIPLLCFSFSDCSQGYCMINLRPTNVQRTASDGAMSNGPQQPTKKNH